MQEIITFNITYYNEPKWLQWWYDTMVELYDRGNDFVFTVGDDGSMIEPAERFFEKNKPHPFMHLYRVTKDVGFNSHGTRNLMIRESSTDWNMLSDIDRHYPIETLERIIHDLDYLDVNSYYRFSHQGEPSVNDYVVNRHAFLRAGGYDEELTNIHWGDRIFLDGLAAETKPVDVLGWSIEYPRGARNVSWTEDVAITTYPDDNTLIHPKGAWTDTEERKALKEKLRQRSKTAAGRQSKQIITFPWTQLF